MYLNMNIPPTLRSVLFENVSFIECSGSMYIPRFSEFYEALRFDAFIIDLKILE